MRMTYGYVERILVKVTALIRAKSDTASFFRAGVPATNRRHRVILAGTVQGYRITGDVNKTASLMSRIPKNGAEKTVQGR
jgi:hypothetical protein